MAFEVFSSKPDGLFCVELPSLLEEMGAERVQSLKRLLGSEGAERATKRIGPYLLDEELTEKLKMKGLDLPEDGEFAVLSANRWSKTSLNTSPKTEMLPSIAGVVLSDSQRKTFQSVLRGSQKTLSVEESLELCRHLFFDQKLKVVVPYTAPRFHQA